MDYKARMEAVLATYERPLRAEEPVVCLDERPIQLTADTRPPSRARPGRPARHDYECKRHGTANLFCAVEPKAGWHLVRATPNRTGPEFAKVIRAIVDHFPAAETIHLVMDNLSTHSRTRDGQPEHAQPQVADRPLRRGDRGRPVGPARGPPLHAQARQLAEPGRDRHRPAHPGVPGPPGRRRIPDLPALRRETTAWKRRANRERRAIRWRFTRRKARTTFGYRRLPHAVGRSRRGRPNQLKPSFTRSED